MKRLLIAIICVFCLILSFPSLMGVISLVGDLIHSGITETCNICIRALRLMAAKTGYSYEFLNVMLFIIVEPLIIFILTITSFFKDKTRHISVIVVIFIQILLFDFISAYYVQCSESANVIFSSNPVTFVTGFFVN